MPTIFNKNVKIVIVFSNIVNIEYVLCLRLKKSCIEKITEKKVVRRKKIA